jgi:L-cysteine:1D-myo-inositol 2-amino-2-deoxy-alpha-D-glucopyranoside ligase
VISWPSPFVPAVPGEPVPLSVHDPASGRLRRLTPGPTARLYVCGITPYDATHLGHAATYLTFDVLQRVWRDNGHTVHYVQNVTDVDDPLLERAARDGLDWRDLAGREIALFHEDMTALAVLPPDDYVGVVDEVDAISDDVARLLEAGAAYPVDVPAGEDGDETARSDVYYDVRATDRFGVVSGWDAGQMLKVFADRGGDPDRPGKRDPLDPLLWRAARPGEPAWGSQALGPGRPGWHIECTTIALRHLGMDFDVQGGGTDLIFPHHEMSAAHAEALTGEQPFARCYLHQAMVGLDGEKMSKSKGNLVLVSRLRADGHQPTAIRLLLLDRHYRTEWSYTPSQLTEAERRLDRWRAALSREGGPDAGPTVQEIRGCLADDLGTPGALAAVDRWAGHQLAEGGDVVGAPGVLARGLDALLGVRV